MTKELEILEGPKVEIHIDLLRIALKTYQIGKRQVMMEYMNSGSRNSRQTCTRNEQIPTRSIRTRIGDQKKDHIDLEEHLQRNCPKQLPPHKLPNDDVENICSKIREKIFPTR